MARVSRDMTSCGLSAMIRGKPPTRMPWTSAGDQLGQLLSTAGDCWEQGEDVPPTVWRRIAEVAAEVSAYATGRRLRTRGPPGRSSAPWRCIIAIGTPTGGPGQRFDDVGFVPILAGAGGAGEI